VEVGGGSCIRLGGPRYAAYEIEPDKPLVDRPTDAFKAGGHR
jgi:hypothetical protein